MADAIAATAELADPTSTLAIAVRKKYGLAAETTTEGLIATIVLDFTKENLLDFFRETPEEERLALLDVILKATTPVK